MGMTMAEKILARAAGRDRVRPGEVITCQVDCAVLTDLGFSVPGYYLPLRKVWDPQKIVVVQDHIVPAPTVEAAEGLAKCRAFAKEFGIPRFHGVGHHGISHQVIAENGYALPGSVLACADSHTCASGAFNCAARGLGGMEMQYVVCKGETWYLVGPTLRYEIVGRLPDMVMPRDIIHYIAGQFGDATGYNVEFVGPTVEEMSIEGRQSIATMCAEISAEFVLFEADHKTIGYLKARTSQPFTPVTSDPDASFAEVRRVDVGTLEPQVVLPHAVPHNAKPVRELEGTPFDQAFIGSCANGRLEDLRLAAAILKGREVHPDVRLIITPASQAVYQRAVKEGLVDIFLEAGATVTNSTCGACFGGHLGVLGPGERCLSSSTRNFKGRMGHPTAEIFLASPATVSASAVAGVIADPRREPQPAARPGGRSGRARKC